MTGCFIKISLYPCKSNMLHSVAVWAKGDEPDQLLHAISVVVFPKLVALDWPLGTLSSANLAQISSTSICFAAKSIPCTQVNLTSHVGEPARSGNQLDREARVCRGRYGLRPRLVF